MEEESNNMKNKVVLITNIPSPYRVPLWDELSKTTDFKTICIAANEKNRTWNIEMRSYIEFLKSYHFFFQKRDWALHFSLPFALFYKLLRYSPNVIIITGYDSFQYWEALLYAKLFRRKTIMWSGSTLLSSRSQNKIVNKVKKFFITSFDSYYTYGTKATEYIESFNVASDKIVTGTNTVDTKYYKTSTSSNHNDVEVINFLYVGQLIERKGLKNTIEVFAKINKKNWKLNIVGTGEQEADLKVLVNRYGLNKKILFAGYKQKSEIIEYYSKANVFLMPSYLEVWGLVLNEALASGLFCLSSKYAGATFDLIDNGKNGFIVDPKDIDDLATKINKTFTIKFNKIKIKDSFLVSYETEAKNIFKAIEKAIL